MSNPLHEIDKLFRDGIESRSEQPSKNLWDNIQSELDKKTVIKYQQKYRSLKRKTSVLLILLLGVVLYEAANLYLRNGTVRHSKEDAFVNVPQHPALQNKDDEEIAREDKAVLDYTKIFHAPQLAEINSARGINKFRNVQSDRDADPATINREMDINTGALEVDNGDKETTMVHDASSGIKNFKNDEYPQLNTLLAFSKMVDNDSWTKDVASGLKPAISGPVLPGYVSPKTLNNPGAGSSQFSFAVYVSPAIAWTTLEDERQQGRRSRSNNSGGGNSGGSNGGNNGGNNNGVNNGGGSNGGTNVNGGGVRSGRGGRGDDRDEIRQSESENLAYSGGVRLGYHLSKKISLQTGLNFLANSTSIKPKLIFAAKDSHGDVGYRINCSAGYTFLKPVGGSGPHIGDSIIVNDTRNAVSYVGVPVVIEYAIFSAGKFSLAASTGAQVNILVGGKTRTVFEKGTVNENTVSGKTQGLKATYFSAIASLAAEMQLKKNLALTLAPAGQFGVSYMNKGTSVKTRPNYLGLTAGLKLKF